ncbi:MAG: DUF354 domain-containing protein [bacterium]
MNILIDIGHPAHVHYYRNLANDLIARDHKVIWTVKRLPVAEKLLNYYGFNYTVFPKKADGLVGKAIRQLHYDMKLLRICKKENIQFAIGTSVTIAHVSAISNLKSILFDDDDDSVQPLVAKFVKPFVNTIVTPDVIKNTSKNTVQYSGYHELAYLHPNRFKPDPKVLEIAGLKKGEVFFIMRFNVFKAHHDLGVKGLTIEQKQKLIEILKPYGKVFITTERDIEPEMSQYQLRIPPEQIHSLMAFSSLFIGDSQTMTQEAAVLGVPALKCNSLAGKLSVPNELEKRSGLMYSFIPSDFDNLTNKLNELLSTPNLLKDWQDRRQRMLKDKIDVTAFWVWFVENYPTSAKVMKENPDYQYNFK